MPDYYHGTDWEDLGDTIADIVDRAVKSKDYQRLNQTITQAVNKAVDSGGEAVRRAAEMHSARRTDSKPNRNMYSSRMGSIPSYSQHVPKQNLPVLYQKTSGKMTTGILKTVGGGVLLLGSSPTLLILGLYNVLVNSRPFFTLSTFFPAAFLAGGAFLLTNGIQSITRLNRFQKYVKALGQKTHCELEQLARFVGKPEKFVRKELPGMIEEGLFLEGHLDDEGKNLITSNETYRHYQQAQQQMLQKRKEEQIAQETSKVNSQVQDVLDKGNAFIREIHSCNDRIPGEEISKKISRMELIVRKIFDRAEAHPEIVPDLKKMMDYYLPMTVKLLRAYADMDAQPIQGDTIRNSKREIEATLDTLNSAFEKLLDSVFKDTAMDVSSDISVLQTLLAQEGLTDDGFGV